MKQLLASVKKAALHEESLLAKVDLPVTDVYILK